MATAKEEGDLWGARAQEWARSNEPAWHDVFTAVLDQARIGKDTRYLDIGCGAGGAMVLARTRGAHVTGFDAAEPLATLARERLPGAKVLVGDMVDLPFVDETFDAVTGINSFQFASDQAQALAEAARVTRPGGGIHLQCPDYRSTYEPHYRLPWLPLMLRPLARQLPCTQFQVRFRSVWRPSTTSTPRRS